MNTAGVPLTTRTYVLTVGPLASTLLAYGLGTIWSMGVFAAAFSLLVWMPSPMGLGMRLLDRDMDAHEEMLMGQASLGQRLRAYAWLLTSATPLGQDLRYYLGGFVVAVGAVVLLMAS